MKIHRIKNKKDIKDIRFGEDYIIDIFGDDLDITEDQLLERNKLMDIVNKKVC